MPSDNQLSPLFGHMQSSSSGDASSPEVSNPPLPDKTNSLIDALSNTAQPEPVASVSAFGDALPELPETPTLETLPEVSLDTVLTDKREASPTSASTDATLDVSQNLVSEIPQSNEKSSQAISDPLVKAIETLIPIPPERSSEDAPSSESVMLNTQELPVLDESDSSTDLEKAEKGDVSSGVGVSANVPIEEPTDPKLSQYLQADKVYQEMIRIESQEKIRLQLAVRYTLLMFAIFLVLAWIVSNRVIMFGFSEFVWLARIRDGLFALMAGLFAMTLWFGSVSWSRHLLVITIIRTLALVFFGAVVVALYIPLW